MDFTHSEERRMIGDTLRRYLESSYSLDQRHEVAASDAGFSKAIWQEMAELGLIGALFSEEVGGFGGEGHDIAIIFEELGRSLVVEPFLATLLAGTALSEAGSAEQKQTLSDVIAGETLIALAHGEMAGRHDLEHIETKAVQTTSGWEISGEKFNVFNGSNADQLVVAARTNGDVTDAEGISLFIVNAKAEGIKLRSYPTVDGYQAAIITFDQVTGELLGAPGNGYAVLEKAVGAGVLAVSAEALGTMDIARDMTVDYLKTRTQFGRPLASFQALQHRLVDLMTEIEQVRSSLINACERYDDELKLKEWSLSALKNLVGITGRLVGEEAIQLHGGIAMTWEYAVCHYVKRMIMIDQVLGDADYHMQRAIALRND